MSTFRITPESLEIHKLTAIEDLVGVLQVLGDLNHTGEQFRIIADYIADHAGMQDDALAGTRLAGAFEAINVAHDRAGHLTADLAQARGEAMERLRVLVTDCMEPSAARKVWATL